MAEWRADLEIDRALAAALISEQFPEQFPPRGGPPIEPLGVGWDNAVFVVGKPPEWAFRFPRRAIAVPGVRREIELLPLLAPMLAVAIPTPRWIGEPSERLGYPWPFFGAPLIAGAEPSDAAPSDADRAAIGAQLGAALRSLHDPALVGRLAGSLPTDPNRRTDMPHRAGMAREWLDRLMRAGLWTTPPSVDGLLSQAIGLPPAPPTVVAHGDLHGATSCWPMVAA